MKTSRHETGWPTFSQRPSAPERLRLVHRFFFFLLHCALTWDSVGSVISITSTCAVTNLHSWLLVASWQLPPYVVRFDVDGFDAVTFYMFAFVARAGPVSRAWNDVVNLDSLEDISAIPKAFDWDHWCCDVELITLPLLFVHWVTRINFLPVSFPTTTVLGVKDSRTPDKSPLSRCRCDSRSDAQQGLSPMRDVFRLWLEAGVPAENPRRHRENQQTPHTERPCGRD